MELALFFSLLVLIAARVSNVDAQQAFPGYNLADWIHEELPTLSPRNVFKNFLVPEFDGSTRAKNECSEQINLFATELMKGAEWALKMADASSKLHPGIMIGNLVDLGMYDECVAIRADVNDTEIRGRHCMYSASGAIAEVGLALTLSICLPATCGPEDVKSIMNKALYMIEEEVGGPIPISFGKATCSAVESPEWTAGGITTLVGFSLLLLFLIICTICDIFLKNYESYSTNSHLVLLRKFSVYSNGIRILSTETTPQALPAIPGLRFFSMCWVILGHEYYLCRAALPVNSADLIEWAFSWKSVYIMIAPYAVDTFFTISGFLVAYLFLKEMAKGRGFNIFSYYIHRYLRLTPAFAALLLMTIFIFPRIGSGAVWDTNMGAIEDDCRGSWWQMLLYVHNYAYNGDHRCLGHTWYLAVDMQFFWISPFILYPLAKKPKIGLIILALCFIASIVIPATITYDQELVSGLVVNNKFARLIGASLILIIFATIYSCFRNVTSMKLDFYTVTHNRASAWLIGIILGYIIFTKNVRPTQPIKWIGWLTAIIAVLFCVFGARNYQLEDYEYHKGWETFFTAASRPAWSIAVAWVLYICVSGCGGPVTKILTLGIFHPFNRISYCMYLVHFIIQWMQISAIRVSRYFSDFIIFQIFLSDFALTAVIGFVFSLVFESPILILEKLVTQRNRRRPDASAKEVQAQIVESGLGKSGHKPY